MDAVGGRGTAEASISMVVDDELLLLLSSASRGSNGKNSEWDGLDRELCPAGSFDIVFHTAKIQLIPMPYHCRRPQLN